MQGYCLISHKWITSILSFFLVLHINLSFSIVTLSKQQLKQNNIFHMFYYLNPKNVAKNITHAYHFIIVIFLNISKCCPTYITNINPKNAFKSQFIIVDLKLSQTFWHITLEIW